MKAKNREALHEMARELVCPINSAKEDYDYCSCHCMAWRERKQTLQNGRNRTSTTIWVGWCGLAGQPADEWDMTDEEEQCRTGSSMDCPF